MRYLSSYAPIAATLACVALIGAGCANTPPQGDEQTPSPTPISTQPTTTPSSTDLTVLFPETAPTVRTRPLTDVCDPQNFICVPAALVNSQVVSPVTASGTAIAFESTFQWTLLGPANQNIAQGTLMASAPDIGQPGAFNLSQAVTIPSGYATGTLRFYESSAQDGSPIHILNIPVTF